MRRRDRGAAATWVALLIVPLLVVGALGIDVGLMQVDRQRLQTGADAAALAIATQCSRGVCTSPTNALAAQDMATANAPLVDAAVATVDVLDRTEGYVEVTTSSTREHFFGPVAGIDSTDLSAVAGARWGYPERGTAVMPISISYCELALMMGLSPVRDLTGTIIGVDIPPGGRTGTIYSRSLSLSATVCLGPLFATLGVPSGLGAGFLFISPGSGCADRFLTIGAWPVASPRTDAPAGCTNADFAPYVGQTVYLPVHSAIRINDRTRQTEYQIHAFVAVTLHGYNLGSGIHSTPNPCPDTLLTPSNRCIDVTLELELGIDSPSDDFEYGPGAPPIGDPRVELVLPEERP